MFVHARNATVRTAMSLIERAKHSGQISCFLPAQGSEYGHAEKQVGHSGGKSQELKHIIARYTRYFIYEQSMVSYF